MTKEEILSALSLLPLAKLEKLYAYSGFILIPDTEFLANVTMAQMVAKANEYRAIHFPEWTDFSESDAGRFLVELMALFSEKDFTYGNMFANQSLLRNMSIYSAAFIRSVELGHEPILCKSAGASFNITFPAGSSFIYPPGGFITVLETSGLKFVNTEPFLVPTSAGDVVIPITLSEGQLLTDTFAFNGHSLPIRKPNIDIEKIALVRNGETWSRVRVFGQSGESSRHFMVLPEENGSATLFFGEDGYGLTPSVGDSMIVSYLKGNASAGNTTVIENANINKHNAARKASSVEQTSIASGGTAQESLASLKNTTPNYFSSKKHAYNAPSVEKFLNNQPEVLKSKANIQGNIVFFYVQPKDGSIADNTLLTALESRLSEVISSGYNPSGLVTTYVDTATIAVDFYLLDGYDIPNTISLGKQLIQDFTNPLVLADYGISFDMTDVSFLLRSKIAGLQNVVFNTVAGVAAADITVPVYRILKKVAFSDITINVITV